MCLFGDGRAGSRDLEGVVRMFLKVLFSNSVTESEKNNKAGA